MRTNHPTRLQQFVTTATVVLLLAGCTLTSSGSNDSGTTIDAGASSDAGSASDAGPDAGVGLDAGNAADASADAGLPIDAGGSALSPCPAGSVFANSPVRLENIASLAPVGLLVPPDHVFPSPHMGISTKLVDGGADAGPLPASNVDGGVSVFAPAALVVTSIGIRKCNPDAGTCYTYDSYTLTFNVCQEMDGYFHLINVVTQPALVQVLQSACVPQGTGAQQFCSMNVVVGVDAGDELGTVRAGSGVDVGIRDYRLVDAGPAGFANPDRWCPADAGRNLYQRCFAAGFVDALASAADRATLYDLIYDSSLTVLRLEEPRTGTVVRDVAGSAQGYWFAPDAAAYTEGPHLYVGPSTFSSEIYSISMGTSVPNTPTYQFRYIPTDAGLVNRRFNEVIDSQVYCFETFYLSEPSAASQTSAYTALTFLMQLADAGVSLTVAARDAGACGSGPWALPTAVGRFIR